MGHHDSARRDADITFRLHKRPGPSSLVRKHIRNARKTVIFGEKCAVLGNTNGSVRRGLKVKVPKGERETIACGRERLFLNALVCILALMLLCHVSMLMQHV